MSELKKEIITIAGRPGSGKSTTAKRVAKALQFTHFSSGDLFRELSDELGQDVLTANQEAEKVDGISEIDHAVDERLRVLGETGSCLVIDSRTAWYWMPQSFRVFLELDLRTAAERILNDTTHDRSTTAERIPEEIDEYMVDLEERLASESRRYERMYGINPYDLSNYDLVVDTKRHNKDEAAGIVLAGYNAWRKQD